MLIFLRPIKAIAQFLYRQYKYWQSLNEISEYHETVLNRQLEKVDIIQNKYNKTKETLHEIKQKIQNIEVQVKSLQKQQQQEKYLKENNLLDVSGLCFFGNRFKLTIDKHYLRMLVTDKTLYRKRLGKFKMKLSNELKLYLFRLQQYRELIEDFIHYVRKQFSKEKSRLVIWKYHNEIAELYFLIQYTKIRIKENQKINKIPQFDSIPEMES